MDRVDEIWPFKKPKERIEPYFGDERPSAVAPAPARYDGPKKTGDSMTDMKAVLLHHGYKERKLKNQFGVEKKTPIYKHPDGDRAHLGTSLQSGKPEVNHRGVRFQKPDNLHNYLKKRHAKIQESTMADKKPKITKPLRSIVPKNIGAPSIEQQDNYPSEKAKEKAFIDKHTILRYPDPNDNEDVFRPKMNGAPEEAPNAGKKDPIQRPKKLSEVLSIDELRGKGSIESIAKGHDKGIDDPDKKTAEYHYQSLNRAYSLRDRREAADALRRAKKQAGEDQMSSRDARRRLKESEDLTEDRVHDVLKRHDLDRSEHEDHVYHPSKDLHDWHSATVAQHGKLHAEFTKLGFKHSVSHGPANLKFHTYTKGRDTVHVGTKTIGKHDHVTHAEREPN